MPSVPAGGPPDPGHGLDEPRPAAVAFLTTEHFALQGARSQTISESTGRPSIFLASSVAAKRRLEVQGLPSGPLQGFLTIAGMTAVITSVLVGATAGLLAAVFSKHSLAASLVAGCVFAVGTMAGLMRYQRAAWMLSDASAETLDTTAVI
jgi:hypothetical protein